MSLLDKIMGEDTMDELRGDNETHKKNKERGSKKRDKSIEEKELENKTWYRAYKVTAVLIVIAAFLAPSFRNGVSGGSFVDGAINIIIWSIIFIILQKIIVYILYGKKIPKRK